jgi:hypothetical protein
MPERASTLYQHVVRGLSEEFSQMEALDKRFITLASDVRGIEQDAIDGTQSGDWARDWDRIESLLTTIGEHTANARNRLNATTPADDPLEGWRMLAEVENEIDTLLTKRKAASAQFTASAANTDWEAGWLALESQFSTLRAHVRSVHVKLELQRRFGEQLAGEIATELAQRLPDDLRDAKGIEALEKAGKQLQEERSQFGGVLDILKALALWVESPEERARKIREND